MGKQVMEQKENERHGQKFYDIFSLENCLTYTHQSIKDEGIKDSSIIQFYLSSIHQLGLNHQFKILAWKKYLKSSFSYKKKYELQREMK